MTIDIRHSLKHAFLGSYAVLVIQFVSSLIVARLLLPEDFGLYSIALVFAMLGELFRNFGVNNYLIKEKKITDEILESSLTILLFIAVVIAIVQYLLASHIGTFYDSVELTNIIQILAINILVSPLGAITQAQLMRDLKTKEINNAQIISQLLSSIITLTLAYFGHDVYSLAFGFLAANIILVIVLRRYRYPNHPKKLGFSKIKEILSFSTYMSGANVIGHIGNSSQDWILGKYLGMESVGLYARGISTVALYDKLVTNSITRILAPTFSLKSRNGEDLSPSYIKLTEIQANIGWPFLILLAILAEPTIELLYGQQWAFVSEFLLWMCLAKCLMLITQSSNGVLMGIGAAKELFYLNLTIHIIRVCCIIYFMSDGLIAVVAGTSMIVQFFRLIFHCYLLHKKINLKVTQLFIKLAKPLIISLVSISPFLFYDGQGYTLQTLGLTFLTAILWLALSIQLKSELINELKRLIIK